MTSHSEMKPKAVSMDEAAKYIGLGRTTLYALARSKKLRLLKVGRKTVVLTADLDAFLDTLAHKAA